MVVHKRKKNTRLRGKTTHGWGSMKKRRGAGHRGGRGNAGSGKRGDCKKPRYWGDPTYMGKHGFVKKNIKIIYYPINIRAVEQQLRSWVQKGKASEEKEVYHIDLVKLGYNKLLSTGKVTKKMKIVVTAASPDAVEKVKAAGGEITASKIAEG